MGSAPVDDFPPIAHRPPMLSLDNTYNEEELRQFDERVRRVLEVDSVAYSCEPKIDGVAISLVYQDGILVRGGTRGDGKRGDDITGNLKTVKSIPLGLLNAPPGIIEVRGEAYMTRDGLAQLNRRAEAEGRSPFANPRNATAGTLKLQDPRQVARRPVRAWVYSLIADDDIVTQTEALAAMTEWGLPVIEKQFRAETLEDVLRYHSEIATQRDVIPYNVDGIVLKVDDLLARETLGNTAKAPRWAIAFKFEAELATTTVIDIEWSVGRQGHITPVADLEPVQLGGTTVKRAGLYNIENVEAIDIRVGDRVVIAKGGEIIPKVVEVLYESRPDAGLPATEAPTYCPACGTELLREDDKAGIFCVNFDCPVQVKARLAHFGSRTAMDVEGLGDAAAALLYNDLDVRDVGDLYSLDFEKLAALEGWGEKSAQNLLDSLQTALSRPLANLIYALGIPGVGLQTAELLAARFPSIDALIAAPTEDIADIHGIGEIIAENVAAFFARTQVKALIAKLEAAGLKLEDESKPASPQPLAGLTFVITGTLPDRTRSEAASRIRELGGKVTSAVSKNTDYLVAGEKPGSKLAKAEELGITVLSSEGLSDLLKENQPE